MDAHAGKVVVLHLECASLQSVRDCAAVFLRQRSDLTLLVCNAGEVTFADMMLGSIACARSAQWALGMVLGTLVLLDAISWTLLKLTDLASTGSSTPLHSDVRQSDRAHASAGVMMCPEGRTVDGIETHFQVNFLAHWLLFDLLRPALLAGCTTQLYSRCGACSGNRCVL